MKLDLGCIIRASPVVVVKDDNNCGNMKMDLGCTIRASPVVVVKDDNN